MMIKNRIKKKHEGEFIPTNPDKYIGTWPIIWRSSWENRMMQWFDLNPSVLEWSSEGHKISYYDPVSQKNRRYFPDFYAKIGKRKFIVEVKPLKDTKLPPRNSKKSPKTIMYQKRTFMTNEAKFNAARNYCEKLGYEFVVLTEKDMFR